MKKDELLTVFGTHDIRTLPECIMSLLFGDQEVRDDVFRELIRCHAGDLSYDWFQEVYEEELSERRKKGQDFTPREVSMLETQLTGAREGVIHEPTAGTGGLIIQYWWELASKQLPWRFKPHTCIFTCWELSDRSIPILLLNMAIRGMMGEVFHGDVLENVAKARYVLLNEQNDGLAFSDIVRDDRVLSYTHANHVLMTWQQASSDIKNNAKNRGVIDSILPGRAMKVLFDDEEVKREMLYGEDNPLTSVYVVDVKVETSQDKPVAYCIVKLHEVFEA